MNSEFKNEWTAEWMANAKKPLKQPKIPSRFVWFIIGMICGSVGMLIYLMWLERIS